MAARLSALICLSSLLFGFISGAGVSRSSGLLRVLSGGNLEVVCSKDGNYQVVVDNHLWLTSAPSYFQANGYKYTTRDGSLILAGFLPVSGADRLGEWTGVAFDYLAGNTPIRTSFRGYKNIPAVVFAQEFPEGAEGTSVKRRNVTLSAFPNFKVGGTSAELGYLAYADKFVGDMGKSIGRWGDRLMHLKDGIDGGPLVLFDKADHAVVMSPFNSFMIASPFLDRNNSYYGWGITGEVEMLPKHYKLETVIYYSEQGINKAMSNWGLAMRRMYKKDTSLRDADFTNNYLSYWTDNGAYYVNYYVRNFLIQNMTYEKAILRYIDFARMENIPYRSLQYSVWYQTFGGTYGGTTLWRSNPKMLPSGMAFMRDSTGLPSTSHNRWWSSKTPYAKQNGGKYSFIIENKYALPQDENFWTDLFAVSQNWGIKNYMQDWLQLPMELMNATNRDVHVAENWLNQMGLGAEKNGITIQYCMSLSRHILQSLAIPAVTQARASDDYQPSDDYSYEQWRIGISSMFADAVGLAPFKDTFWTTSDQPGNFYKARDPYVELQSLVASLSAGPVGPGDMINGTNRTLLMSAKVDSFMWLYVRCCNEDGLILKPSRPAFPVNDQLIQSVFGGMLGPQGEVWTTYSDVGSFRFGIIFGAAMDSSNMYALGPKEAGFGPTFPRSRIYSYRDTPSALLPEFSESHPLTLTNGCTRGRFCLYYTSPVLKFRADELVLLGELSKWIPVSPKRVLDISYDQDDFRVTLTGAAGEVVSFSAVYRQTYLQFHCVLSQAGLAIISFRDTTCRY